VLLIEKKDDGMSGRIVVDINHMLSTCNECRGIASLLMDYVTNPNEAGAPHDVHQLFAAPLSSFLPRQQWSEHQISKFEVLIIAMAVCQAFTPVTAHA
jgi:hypothetical protein